MNIAYLFSGHARTWEYCSPSFFSNIYNFAPGDIFIHTWDRINSYLPSHWNAHVWSGDTETISSIKTNYDKIIKTYNPIGFMIQQDPGVQKWIDKYPNINKDSLAIKNLLYSQNMVYQMAKTHKKYDRFFCTRMDINYTSTINITELFCSEYVISNSRKHASNMIFDFWSIGSQEQIDIKCQYYHAIDKYWFPYNMNSIFYEHALYNYLQDNSIPILKSSVTYNVPRINNIITDYIS